MTDVFILRCCLRWHEYVGLITNYTGGKSMFESTNMKETRKPLFNERDSSSRSHVGFSLSRCRELRLTLLGDQPPENQPMGYVTYTTPFSISLNEM
jgi:hypothetical protein